MSNQTRATIEETLSHFQQLVVSDGGSLRIRDFDEDSRRLSVEYNKGHNDECMDCVITHEHLQVFISEALAARKADVAEVAVLGE
jgi:Fe-S cluster biogenesis protein NfuA